MLHDKYCLITGGGTGIGRATAFRMAQEGATVWIAGVNAPELEKTAGEVGRGCAWRMCDVRQAEQVSQVVGEIPRLDVLVANAAICRSVDLLKDPVERWRELIEVNMWGAVNTCRAGGEKMIRQGTGGRIVIVSSLLGGMAEPLSGPYSMAKAALNQLGRQLAAEWAEHGILVNVVAPGCVQTPMSFFGGSNEYESEWFKEFFVNPKRPRIPLMRPGRPQEIAEAIVFFANPANSYCTGSVLTVDGGLGMKY